MEQIVYFNIINILILVITAYYIKSSPVKAVKVGRLLDDEQNKYNIKRELFLTLFSLRGSPTHYTFVNNLNMIDVVFEDTPTVLTAWEKLFTALNTPNSNQNIDLLRIELLSEMAQSLGYDGLRQTTIQKNYLPQAHINQIDENWNYQQTAKSFFESGAEVYKIWLSQFNNYQQ